MTDIEASLRRAISVQLARLQRTQAWLADQVDMSPTALSNRMNGITPFDLRDVAAISNALQLASSFDLIRLAASEAQELSPTEAEAAS